MPDTGPSDRVLVAELARDAALAVPGVFDLAAGIAGRFATAGGGVRIDGVTSAGAPGGGYDVHLRLICMLITLPPVADAVRAAVFKAAAAARLDVATVTIDIVDVRDPSLPEAV